MIFKSIIKEGVPTINNRIYEEGSLQKFKDYLQEKIDNKTCFVWFGNVRLDETNLNDYVGIVESFAIEDGVGIFDITLLDKPEKQIIESMSDKFFVDFYLAAKIFEDSYQEEHRRVDLSEMSLSGLRLLNIQEDYKDQAEVDKILQRA